MDFTQIEISEQAKRVPYLLLVYLEKEGYDIKSILECQEVNVDTYRMKYIPNGYKTPRKIEVGLGYDLYVEPLS